MWRRWLVPACLYLIVTVAVNTWLAYLLYVQNKDDRATAQVETCSAGRGYKDGTCRGTWRTPDGRTGAGVIGGAPSAARKTEVTVRLTPDGGARYVKDRDWLIVAIPLGYVLINAVVIGLIMFAMRRSRRRAAGLFSGSEGGPVLQVSGAEASREGRMVAVQRPSPAPAGQGPDGLPWPRRRPTEPVSMLWTTKPSKKERFATVADASGSPLFMVERRADGKHLPDLCLLGPDGTPRAIVRKTAQDDLGYEVLDSAGAAIGALHQKSGNTIFEIRDKGGVNIGLLGCCGRGDWRLRLDDRVPADLRYAALAAALNINFVLIMD